jgi:hypothetical protein
MRRVLLILLAACSDTTPALPTMCPNDKCAVANAFFAAEVTPVTPASTPNAVQPSQEIAQIFVDSDNKFSITLERAITLDGAIDDNGTPVPAGIVMRRPSHIAGRTDVFYTTHAGDRGDFSAVVSPTHDGEFYTLRVQPDDTAHRPPEVFLVDAAHDRTLALHVTPPATLLQIHGTVTDALQVPVVGMQVQAHDPETDALVSTTAVTDAQGSFALRVAVAQQALPGNPAPPPPLAAVKLVAQPPQAPMPGMWLPRLEQTVDVTRAGAINSLTVNLALPPLPNAVQLVYAVVGTSTSGKKTPVAGAHCEFSADVSDPKSETRAYYEVSADTDATGNASAMLIPASGMNRDYLAGVSPPSQSEFQALSTTVSVGPAGGYSGDIQLPLRAQVTGKVLGPDGAPVRNLTITPYPATLATLLAPSSQNTISKLSDGFTDVTGSFVLRVDNGRYDLALLPTAASKLPRWWIEDQSVGGDVELPAVSMPPASPVDGTVFDAAGTPLVGADVKLYLLSSHNLACATNDYACLAPPRLIAEGTVAPDGTVSVLLPGALN